MTYTQDRRETLDYGFDWELQPGEEITASDWLNPDGYLTLADAAFTATATVVFASVAGAPADGTVATLTNTIETDQDRIRVQSLTVKIETR